MTLFATSLDIPRPSSSKGEHRCQDRSASVSRSPDGTKAARTADREMLAGATADTDEDGSGGRLSRSRSPEFFGDRAQRRQREGGSNGEHRARSGSRSAGGAGGRANGAPVQHGSGEGNGAPLRGARATAQGSGTEGSRQRQQADGIDTAPDSPNLAARRQAGGRSAPGRASPSSDQDSDRSPYGRSRSRSGSGSGLKFGSDKQRRSASADANGTKDRDRPKRGRDGRHDDPVRGRDKGRERDRCDPGRSRSRSRSRSQARELDRCRDRDRELRDAGPEAERGGDHLRGTLAAAGVRHGAGVAAVPAAGAHTQRTTVAFASATSPSASPRGAAQQALGSRAGSGSRPLVSFSDELDEEGGLGGGGGGLRTSGGGGAAAAAGGSLRTSGGGAAAGAGGGTGGLAASTAQRFLREEAAQRLTIPPRTITTTTTSSLPLPLPLLMGSGSLPPLLHPLGSPSFGHHHYEPVSSPFPPRFASAPTHGSGQAVGNGLAAQYQLGSTMSNRVGGSAAAAAESAGDPNGAEAIRGASPVSSSGRTLGRVVFGVASARCARPYMEDRHCIVHCLRPMSSSGQPLQDGVQRSLAAIYDGHNGTRAADTAATRLHTLLAAEPALRTHTGELGPPAAMAAEEAAIGTALRRCFRRLDDEILAEARADGARDGATALLVMRLSDTIYAAHAGDSRAVMARRGAALRLTEDHKPHLPVEKARVEAAGGRVDFQRCWRVIVEPREGRLGSGLAVSRSLGDLDFKEPRRFVECEPDVKRLVPVPGDNLVVLGSDGLWDVMSDQEAVDCANAVLQARYGRSTAATVAYREEDARAAAEGLLEAAVRRGTADNVTVVIMMLQWD